MAQIINRNVLIQAHWPGPSRRMHEVLALVTYPSNEAHKESGVIQSAWVIYKGELIEAFYIENEGWILDDIGINNINVEDTPDGYPGAEYLRGTGWYLEKQPVFGRDKLFWIPIKDA